MVLRNNTKRRLGVCRKLDGRLALYMTGEKTMLDDDSNYHNFIYEWNRQINAPLTMLDHARQHVHVAWLDGLITREDMQAACLELQSIILYLIGNLKLRHT